MLDDGCGAVGGIIIGKGNRSPKCRFVYHKSHHDLTWARTRTAALESWQITECATVRPHVLSNSIADFDHIWYNDFSRVYLILLFAMMWLCYLAYSSTLKTLKLEEIFSPEKSFDDYQPTWRYVLHDGNFSSQCHKNLKSIIKLRFRLSRGDRLCGLVVRVRGC
jgi:hypothetical protein